MNARRKLLLAAQRAEARTDDPTRHKCFVSYHADDADEIADFIDYFGHVFIPRVIGVSDEDDFIDSDDADYVMRRIRDKYLRDSTVTIVMVGQCTWARRYVDWEVYSSLRNAPGRPRNGLMAVTLPAVANNPARRLPARVDDNVDETAGYARWFKYPTSASQLRSNIETVFGYRTSRGHLADNTRARRMRSAMCP